MQPQCIKDTGRRSREETGATVSEVQVEDTMSSDLETKAMNVKKKKKLKHRCGCSEHEKPVSLFHFSSTPPESAHLGQECEREAELCGQSCAEGEMT